MTGPESACIPGLVAGLALALQEYGTKPLDEVLAPAIRLARDGFALDAVLYDRLSELYGFTEYGTDPVIGPIYFPDGLVPEIGSPVVNEDLARALESIAEEGAYAFYRGELADAIVEAMDGWFTSADLQRYQAVERDAILSEYRGYTVIGTPPNVAGTVIAEALNILDNFDLSETEGWQDPKAIHLMAEALKLASADRVPYVGDPDFYDVPLAGLLSEEYATQRAALIDLGAAMMPTRETPAGNPYPFMEPPIGAPDGEESPSTTHISVLDEAGNAVAITQTISSFWGSQDMIPGYGFFMNNELHNFNSYNPDRSWWRERRGSLQAAANGAGTHHRSEPGGEGRPRHRNARGGTDSIHRRPDHRQRHRLRNGVGGCHRRTEVHESGGLPRAPHGGRLLRGDDCGVGGPGAPGR